MGKKVANDRRERRNDHLVSTWFCGFIVELALSSSLETRATSEDGRRRNQSLGRVWTSFGNWLSPEVFLGDSVFLEVFRLLRRDLFSFFGTLANSASHLTPIEDGLADGVHQTHTGVNDRTLRFVLCNSPSFTAWLRSTHNCASQLPFNHSG